MGAHPISSHTMATESTPDDPIELPTAFADHLVTVGNLASAPRTVSELFAMFADELSASDGTIDAADMYTEQPTRHAVHLTDRVRYSPCVLDALTAAMLEPQDPLTVRSIDPITDRPVTFTVTGESVDVDPAGALIAFGIARTIPDLGPDESVVAWILRDDAEGVEAAFCQHINAFESTETYEKWRAESDAETVPIRPAVIDSLIGQYVSTE